MSKRRNEKSKDHLKNESCDAILDTAKAVYEEEMDRLKQTEAKANITITFLGVLLGVFITYIKGERFDVNNSYYLIMTYAVYIVIFVNLSLSAFFFLFSLKSKGYEQVDLEKFLTYEIAKDSENNVKLSIAATYGDAVKANKNTIQTKIKYYDVGLILMIIGMVLFFLIFLVTEAINVVY